MSEYEIRRYADGMYQVWRGREVLSPGGLKWEPHFQACHDFMRFHSEDDAQRALKEAVAKFKQVDTKKVRVTIEEEFEA